MADVFDIAKRSQVMSRIRGRGNVSTEEALRIALRKAGVTGWRRHVQLRPLQSSVNQPKRRISVTPDFVFRQARLAVFVDGCFWHGCPVHSTKPATNPEFWAAKLQGNIDRDKRATRALEAAGWTVLRIWEHELLDGARAARRVLRRLGTSRAAQ